MIYETSQNCIGSPIDIGLLKPVIVIQGGETLRTTCPSTIKDFQTCPYLCSLPQYLPEGVSKDYYFCFTVRLQEGPEGPCLHCPPPSSCGVDPSGFTTTTLIVPTTTTARRGNSNATNPSTIMVSLTSSFPNATAFRATADSRTQPGNGVTIIMYNNNTIVLGIATGPSTVLPNITTSIMHAVTAASITTLNSIRNATYPTPVSTTTDDGCMVVGNPPILMCKGCPTNPAYMDKCVYLCDDGSSAKDKVCQVVDTGFSDGAKQCTQCPQRVYSSSTTMSTTLIYWNTSYPIPTTSVMSSRSGFPTLTFTLANRSTVNPTLIPPPPISPTLVLPSLMSIVETTGTSASSTSTCPDLSTPTASIIVIGTTTFRQTCPRFRIEYDACHYLCPIPSSVTSGNLILHGYSACSNSNTELLSTGPVECVACPMPCLTHPPTPSCTTYATSAESYAPFQKEADTSLSTYGCGTTPFDIAECRFICKPYPNGGPIHIGYTCANQDLSNYVLSPPYVCTQCPQICPATPAAGPILSTAVGMSMTTVTITRGWCTL